MGFGRSEAKYSESEAQVIFERGGWTQSWNDSAADKAIEMAYLKWLESFLYNFTDVTRSEFDEIKWFIFRGLTAAELADLRAQRMTGRDEHIRRWHEEQARENQKQQDLYEAARREREERAQTSARLARAETRLDSSEKETRDLNPFRPDPGRKVFFPKIFASKRIWRD